MDVHNLDYFFILRQRKLQGVAAKAGTDHRPMISIFHKLGFEIDYAADATAEVSKIIA